MTYIWTVLVALDELAAALFFNRLDICVSSMAYLVSIGKDQPLKLNKFQRWFLVKLGPILNKIQNNHMALSAQSDLGRAQAIKELLE